MPYTTEDLKAMVDVDSGLISGRIFTDREIYDLEMRDIFHHTWQFLAHISQIPKPGDFFSTYMGEDPILVVRQRDGSVKALLNACRHRGMRVCRADAGTLRAFTCTYHGWTYDMAGRLVNVPNFEDSYYSELEPDKWGLVEIAQVGEYKGLIFGNFDPNAPSLVDYLGPMAWWLDNLLDRREGGTEVSGSVHKIRFKGNWKFAAEQFAGDNYHAPTTHVSAFFPGGPSDGARIRGNPEDGRQWSTRQGHGIVSHNVGDGGRIVYDALRADGDVELADYYEQLDKGTEQRLGPKRPVGIGTVFPNFSYLNGNQLNTTISAWHPKGPNAFEQWRIVLVDKEATDREKYILAKGAAVWPLGLADADDGENWGEIGRNLLNSPLVQDLVFNYQMGINHERDDDTYYPPGRTSYGRVAEGSQRSFYRRWLDFMVAHGGEWPRVQDRITEGARS